MTLRQLLLTLHFVGLVMGFSVSFANMVVGAISGRSSDADRAVLGRIPPVMSTVGSVGLLLLWASGIALIFGYWGGSEVFTILGWAFYVKMACVVVLTGLVGYMHALMPKAGRGDVKAAARIPLAGKFAFLSALLALVMAVLAFH